MSELHELREGLKRMQAILAEKFPELQTTEERTAERIEKMKAEQESRFAQLEAWKEAAASGQKTIEEIFNLKRNARYNNTGAEEFFISPPGLKKAGSAFFKEARKYYIENLINTPGAGFYRLKNSLWKEPIKLLGFVSNPGNPKDVTGTANAAYARQEFLFYYTQFVESITPPDGAEIIDFCGLLEGIPDVAGIPVKPYVFA